MRRPFLLRLVEDYWGILLLLLAWQAWVAINSFNPIVMPTPVAVIGDLVGHPGVYLRNVGITLSVALFGLAMGMLVGTALAVAAWFSAIASGLLNPLTVLFSSVPVVALIPVIARLLGYDTSTVLAIVVIITFFPSFVFASSGLRQPPAGAEDLFRVLGASRLDLLLRLALPSAMPNLAIAFKLAAAHAILAAMVAVNRLAPWSARSSRATAVSTTYWRLSRATASATRSASWRSKGLGAWPLST